MIKTQLVEYGIGGTIAVLVLRLVFDFLKAFTKKDHSYECPYKDTCLKELRADELKTHLKVKELEKRVDKLETKQ